MKKNESLARLYHRVPSDRVGTILEEGLRVSKGSGVRSNQAIDETDSFLNSLRGAKALENGLDRTTAIYCYFSHEGGVIDIRTGEYVPLSAFIDQCDDSVLELSVRYGACYVSDLDVYDKVIELREAHSANAMKLGMQYWNKIVPLSEYMWNPCERVEVMVIEHVTPSMINVLKHI